MKKSIRIGAGFALGAILLFSGCTTKKTAEYSISDKVIKTVVPERPKGQRHVVGLRCEPIKTVRVGIIGLGMRGPGALIRMMNIPGVEIKALCDIDSARVVKANQILTKKGFPKAKEFYGSKDSWKNLSKMKDLDLVYVVTPWQNHAEIGVQAMNDGKHVAIEVPAAMSLQEIWDLINTSERTRKHCIQLENCVYDFFELTTLNMVQKGLLGEVLHGEGAYIHQLDDFWKAYWDNWRLDFNKEHRGDVYPTHGLGPVCLAMNIHRGDKMEYLVSVDTKPLQLKSKAEKMKGKEWAKDFKNGDHTMTMIRTKNGKSIMIQHDVTSPRPYNRLFQISGTKGFANKYPVEGFAFQMDSKDASNITPNHENLNAHTFVSEDTRKKIMKDYRHPIVDEKLEKLAKKVGGHGGMDFIMDYRLIYCLQNGLPLDMDVYDLAEWCSLIPLTEISLTNNSMPVEVPDFTRGHWNEMKKVEFSIKGK